MRLFQRNTLGITRVESLEDALENLLLLLQGRELVANLFKLSLLCLADGTLMVTQDCNLAIGIVVLGNLFGRSQARKRPELFRLAQFVLKSLGSIVRSATKIDRE